MTLLSTPALAEREALLREIVESLDGIEKRRALEIVLSWVPMEDLRECAEVQRFQDRGPK